MAKFGYIRDRSATGYVFGLCFEFDGGFANVVFLNPDQLVSGGSATSTYIATQIINFGGA